MKQAHVGLVLIGIALVMVISNIADAMQELKDWHGVVNVITPALVAPALKQLSATALGALGGKMLNPFGEKP